MQKVISVNLNGNAYQLDESGYDALSAYLDVAGAQLLGNPDKPEIMADLEQSIADKCGRFLSRAKTVVTTAEVEQVLKEIGPVDGGHTAAQAQAARESTAHEPTPRKLYRVREGAMISGVCNGIAAYFNVDATIVRIIFVALAFLKGTGVILYGLLMLIVPYARTPDERVAAQGFDEGLPDRIQRVIEKMKRKISGMFRRSARPAP